MKYSYFQYFGTTMGQMVDGKMVYHGITINGHVDVENPPAVGPSMQPRWGHSVLVQGVRLRGCD